MLNTEAIRRQPDLIGNGGVSPEGFLEIIPDRLYWVSTNVAPKNSASHHFFSIDNELVYEPFFADFGPLNLSCTFRYCKVLCETLLGQQVRTNLSIAGASEQSVIVRCVLLYTELSFPNLGGSDRFPKRRRPCRRRRFPLSVHERALHFTEGTPRS